MTVDSRRKLAFLSKDSGNKGIVTIDVKDPWNPQIVSFQPTLARPHGDLPQRLPLHLAGRRRRLGPARLRGLGDRHPRPRASVHVRERVRGDDPAHDRRRAARRTRSTSTSTAWPGSPAPAALAAGGPRACTRTRSPAQMRYATPYDPLPYGGGSVTGATGTFMHNAYHVPQALGDQAAGDTMLITNENNNTNCATAGLFFIASLKGTRDVENNLPGAPVDRRRSRARWSASRRTRRTASRAQFHGTVTTTNSQGARHHDRRRLLGALVHGQGQHRRARQLRAGHALRRHLGPAQPAAGRLLPRPGQRHDQHRRARSSRATRPAAYWHGKYVYVSDYARGIDVLKFNGADRQDPVEDVLELVRRQPDDGRLGRQATAARAARCRRRCR